MYCIKCGADNSETAAFCRKCGVLMVDPEEETRIAARKRDVGKSASIPVRVELDNITVGSSVHPAESHASQVPVSRETDPVSRARPPLHGKAGSQVGGEQAKIFSISPTLMFVKGGYVLAAAGALLLVALTSTFFSQFISVWMSVLIGLLLFLVPAYYHFRQKLVRYTLTDSTLEIDLGFISRTTRNVPIRRIQDVTVSATPWQRLLGFGDITIDNASDEDGKVVLKNINAAKKYADEVLRQIRRLDG